MMDQLDWILTLDIIILAIVVLGIIIGRWR